MKVSANLLPDGHPLIAYVERNGVTNRWLRGGSNGRYLVTYDPAIVSQITVIPQNQVDITEIVSAEGRLLKDFVVCIVLKENDMYGNGVIGAGALLGYTSDHKMYRASSSLSLSIPDKNGETDYMMAYAVIPEGKQLIHERATSAVYLNGTFLNITTSKIDGIWWLVLGASQAEKTGDIVASSWMLFQKDSLFGISGDDSNVSHVALIEGEAAVATANATRSAVESLNLTNLISI